MARKTAAPAVWLVEVRIEDNDPQVFGPYTEAQARRAAARIEEEVALATDTHGMNFHPRGALGASAYPISPYDTFLTGEERRQARGEVRGSERATQ